MPFTSAWQSSNVPSMATALTLAASAVVIMRRCTSEMRPLREQHDEIDLTAIAERLDGGAAGIARGRHHDGPALAARGQHMIHQPRQKLHRQILEGERRPVEQFERKRIHAELRQRRDRGMAKIAVGLARHAGEIGLADRIVGEAPDHLHGDFGIGPAGEGRRSSAAQGAARHSGT